MGSRLYDVVCTFEDESEARYENIESALVASMIIGAEETGLVTLSLRTTRPPVCGFESWTGHVHKEGCFPK